MREAGSGRWSALFIGIHLLQIWGLLRERRPVRFTHAELILYRRAFAAMPERDFLHLMRSGRWENAPPQRCLISEGARVTDLIVLSSGSVDVKIADNAVAELEAGC